MGKAQEFKHSDQLAVVRNGECPFEVEIAENIVLLVGVSIFHTKV